MKEEKTARARYIIIDCPKRKELVGKINNCNWRFSKLTAISIGLNKILISVWEGLGIDEIDDCLEEFGGFYESL